MIKYSTTLMRYKNIPQIRMLRMKKKLTICAKKNAEASLP